MRTVGSREPEIKEHTLKVHSRSGVQEGIESPLLEEKSRSTLTVRHDLGDEKNIAIVHEHVQQLLVRLCHIARQDSLSGLSDNASNGTLQTMSRWKIAGDRM
jgi:hypothetical protein